jgi:filamentous hemagglutinin family protein
MKSHSLAFNAFAPGPGRRRPGLLRPLALAAACLFAAQPGRGAGPSPALPSGLQVVQGQATLAQAGNRLTVSNSANSVLNWQQFSIGAGNAVHFAQPTAASKVLNRVVGADPSAILGSLSSNGQVWLLNPNGVLFGAGARVDVAGLVASTLQIGDADWAAGRWSLTGSAAGAYGASGPFGGAASVVNQGELRTVNGGRVLLIGSGSARNEGLIAAPDGQVLLAAGRSVELVDSGLPNLSVRLTAPQGEAVNLGTVLAGGGRIDLQAGLVNQQGILRADRLDAGQGGRGGQVALTASSGVDLGVASQTSANGAAGGQVTVDGGTGATLVTGSVSATGSLTMGGGITLLGRQVGLLDAAVVDASGATGGGAVRVGGGLQGRDAAYRNAEAVYMAPGATITADASARGDGGLVVLWSDQATRVYGSLSAQGGPAGGNGGFIETSGHWLDARPRSVRATAQAGRAGQWLIDPDDILITDFTSDAFISDVDPGASYNFTSILPGGPSSPTEARLSTATIVSALNAGNNVTVTTGASGGGNGDIRLSGATIKPSPPAPVSLSLHAIRNITAGVSEIASANGQPLTINLLAGYQGGISGGNLVGGAIQLNRLNVDTRGGDLSLGGNSIACGVVCDPLTAPKGAVAASATSLLHGIEVIDSVLDAGAGSVTMAGHSLVSFAETYGVVLRGGTVSGRVIDLTGSVISDGNVLRTGVAVLDGSVSANIPHASLIAAERLSLNGSATSTSFHVFPSRPVGVEVRGDSLLQVGLPGGSPTAQLSIQGRVQDEEPPSLGSLRYAVGLHDNARLVALGGAAVDIGSVDRSSSAAVIGGVFGLEFAGTAAALIDASQASRLTLQSTDARISLSGALRAPEGGSLQLLAGGALDIPAATLSGNPSQVTMSGSAVNIGALGSTAQLVFGANTTVSVSANSVVLGGLIGTDPNPPQATLSAGGAISVNADALHLGASGQLSSTAAGDAITLRGYSAAPNILSFVHDPATAAITAPNGRWLLYLQDSGPLPPVFQPGGLVADFRQYAASGPNAVAAQATGNGILLSSAPLLSLSSDFPVTRVYDATTAVDLDAFFAIVTGLKDDEQFVGGLGFVDKQVGSVKPLQVVPDSGGLSVVTTGGLPVYGYRLDAVTMVGAITPRGLTTGSAEIATKVYDGGAAATVSQWTLAGVLPGDKLQVQAGSAAFTTPGVGGAIAVNASVSSLGGPDAGNYEISNLVVSASGAITARPLSLASVAIADKVYDGGLAASVAGWTLANVVGNDQVQVSAGSGQFSSAGVGTAKPVLATASSLGGADAANYSLGSAASQSGSAAITPRPLGVAGVAVADKVYDGGRAASVTQWTLSNLVPGDQVQVTAGTGQFSSAGVGSAKPVLAIASGLGGADAANYRLGSAASASGRAAITPAPLRYLADPANVLSGLPIPVLTGTVTGFVNGESLANATSGSLVFTTAATEASSPGLYAIAGSGLAAANYTLAQAAANATALALTPSEPGVLPVNPFVTQTAVTRVLPATEPTSPASGRALDAVQAVRPGGSDSAAFASLDLASLSPAAVAGLLAARDEYKKATFQQALAQLELDPSQADAPGCATAQQAATGQCLITAPLAGAQGLSNARVDDRSSAAGPPGGVPAPAAAPTPTAAPAGAAVSSPVAAAVARPAQAALPPRPPQPVVDLPARRGVKTATLPQIQRKIALVIGIDQYADARIPRLANAANDARAVAASLESNLGYETVVLENANRSGIFRALNQLVAQVGPADSVVVYYAGHGERAEKSGLGYWQPADADPTRADTWISNADIDRVLRQLPASQVALISDSCYSGSLVSGERIRGATTPQDPASLLGRRAAVVMTSGGNEPVFDSGKNGHSPFAWSLMQSLQQVSTWKAGSTVFEQVRFAVARQLPQRPQYAAAPNAGHQSGSDFLFEQRQLEGVVK